MLKLCYCTLYERASGERKLPDCVYLVSILNGERRYCHLTEERSCEGNSFTRKVTVKFRTLKFLSLIKLSVEI